MQTEEVLQTFGLTNAEVKLYLELLKSGEATASELAKQTSTNRTFTYDRLKKLLETGLTSSIVKDNKKYFSAAKPEQLLSLLKEREEQVKAILPTLEKLSITSKATANVQVYSTKKGIRTALNLALKTKNTEVLLHGTIKLFKETMESYFDIWNQRREKENITVRALTNEEIELPLAEIDLLTEQTNTTISTFTFLNKTIIALWSQNPIAILIESKEIAEENTLFFNDIWNREIKIYSGVTGIRKAWMELVSEKSKELVGYGFSYGLAQIYGRDFSQKWHEERQKNSIKTRIISDNDKESKKYFDVRMIEWKDFNIRFLNKETSGPACITLSDTLLVEFIYTEEKLKVILSKNKEMITAYKKYFETLWKKTT